jgi:hypothetical protein
MDPVERLAAIRKEFDSLSKMATYNLAPLKGRVPEIGSFLAAIDALVKKGNEFDARLKANSSLSSSDWDSLKLTPSEPPWKNSIPATRFAEALSNKLLLLQRRS